MTERAHDVTIPETGRRGAGGVDAPLTPLELRLEVSNRISNSCFDFLNRLSDQRAISERYLARDVNLHIHISSGDGVWCLTFEAMNAGQVAPLKAGMNGDTAIPPARDEMPVFIRVGAIPEPPRPVASVVWLQPLDACDMGGVDAFEIGCLAASREVLWRVHNRKLRAVLRAAGIKDGEFEDEIVQGASEVVANLASQGAYAHAEEGFARRPEIYDAMRRVWIEIERNGVSLFLKDDRDFPLKLRKVFICPNHSFEAAVKRVTEIIGHADTPRDVLL